MEYPLARIGLDKVAVLLSSNLCVLTLVEKVLYSVGGVRPASVLSGLSFITTMLPYFFRIT